MVAAEGLEGALTALLDAGVAVSLDEFKQRADEFDNPLAKRHMTTLSSGSRISPRRVGVDLERVEHDARHHALFRDGFALGDRPYALWRAVPPSGSGFNNGFRQVRCGEPVAAVVQPLPAAAHRAGRPVRPVHGVHPRRREGLSRAARAARAVPARRRRAGGALAGRAARGGPSRGPRHPGGPGRADVPGGRGARPGHRAARSSAPGASRSPHAKAEVLDARRRTRGEPLLDGRDGPRGRGLLRGAGAGRHALPAGQGGGARTARRRRRRRPNAWSTRRSPPPRRS